ncbi:hypothetical protein COPR103792_08665 [Corynebacterium propinquum]
MMRATFLWFTGVHAVSSFKVAAMRWSDVKTILIIKDGSDFSTNKTVRMYL